MKFLPCALPILLIACAIDDPPADVVPDAPPHPHALDDDWLRDLPKWQRLRENAQKVIPPLSSTPETLQEYAAKCDAAIGLTVRSFNCLDGELLDGQGTTPAGHGCDRPNVLNHHCDPGARFKVLDSNAEAAVVAHCRKVGLPENQRYDEDNDDGFYRDIAVIQYNKVNGAVCFYQALRNDPLPGDLPGKHVAAPSTAQLPEQGWSHWIAPMRTHDIDCTGCHDSGGFVRSPYIAQSPSLPSHSTGYNNLDTPLRYVGVDYAGDRSWSVQTDGAPCPPGETCQPCTTCHRLAANNVRPLNGTAAQFAEESTAQHQRAKNPHSATSPIWMRPGQTLFKQEAFDSALAFKNCALQFSAAGTPPVGCSMTPLGLPYESPISPTTAGDDIALVGGTQHGAQIAVAFSNRDGSFAVTNSTGEYFSELARLPGVKRVAADFNEDGELDFALVGGVGWLTIPVAMSRGDGTFHVTNSSIGPDFNNLARTANVTVLVGDFNKDGTPDIALTGGAGWTSIPVASNAAADGTFIFTNTQAGAFGAWAATAGARPLVGDFNGDGCKDIALVGVGGWASIPVAFGGAAYGGGQAWTIANQPAPSFGPWSAAAHVTALTGDFNRDGSTDIALTGAVGWASIPIAFGAGGSWIVTNHPAAQFAVLASRPGVAPLTGDFNGDGFTDLALTGDPAWHSIPIAHAAGAGYWNLTNGSAPSFGAFASTSGARSLAGDFDGDGFTDIAIVGGAHFESIPVAFGMGHGNWRTQNRPIRYFALAARDPGATIVVGRLN